jgi:5-formyltetrahydrofolate cyclo-ligase
VITPRDDVVRWRKAERDRLIRARLELPADYRAAQTSAIASDLNQLIVSAPRLGYGGGFFDRTLAGFDSTPLVIGVGYPGALIPTIYPQPHDIPMDWIVTGAAPALRRV